MTGRIHEVRRWLRWHPTAAVVILANVAIMVYGFFQWNRQGRPPMTDHDLLIILVTIGIMNLMK